MSMVWWSMVWCTHHRPVCLLKRLTRGGCIFTLSAAEEVRAILGYHQPSRYSTWLNQQKHASFSPRTLAPASSMVWLNAVVSSPLGQDQMVLTHDRKSDPFWWPQKRINNKVQMGTIWSPKFKTKTHHASRSPSSQPLGAWHRKKNALGITRI